MAPVNRIACYIAKNCRTYSTPYGPVNPFPKPHGNPEMWKKILFFVGFPSILIAMGNAYSGHQKDHKKPRPKFVPYPYLCKRSKPFPWGDGNHTFFHNPHLNALPTGYETEDPHAVHNEDDEHE